MQWWNKVISPKPTSQTLPNCNMPNRFYAWLTLTLILLWCRGRECRQAKLSLCHPATSGPFTHHIVTFCESSRRRNQESKNKGEELGKVVHEDRDRRWKKGRSYARHMRGGDNVQNFNIYCLSASFLGFVAFPLLPLPLHSVLPHQVGQ